MKTKELIVPKEIIEEFSDLIAEHEIENSIQGSTEDGEIIVEVQYEKEERQGGKRNENQKKALLKIFNHCV